MTTPVTSFRFTAVQGQASGSPRCAVRSLGHEVQSTEKGLTLSMAGGYDGPGAASSPEFKASRSAMPPPRTIASLTTYAPLATSYYD